MKNFINVILHKKKGPIFNIWDIALNYSTILMLFEANHTIFSVPTAAAKRKEILKLYESILTGSSKCHATGNEKDASGGWYKNNETGKYERV